MIDTAQAVPEPASNALSRSEAPQTDLAVGLSVSSAAASVGLTPATLRTWDRRYGLSPSVRTGGGHRRYNDADLIRLRLAARMVEDGLPPAGAVGAVMEHSVEACADLLRPSARTASARAASARTAATRAVPSAAKGAPSRAGGGRMIAITDATAEQRGMARAAMALDGRAVRALMTEAISERGVIGAWDDLAVPTLIGIGNQWARTQSGVEVEHVTSLALQQALDAVDVAEPMGRPVLLSCAPSDRHSLPLLALRAALAERGVDAVLLGPQVPAAALAATVARLRPRAIVIWASMSAHADLDVLEAIPRQRPAISVYVAGPGWAGSDDLDPELQMLTSFSAAVDELAVR